MKKLDAKEKQLELFKPFAGCFIPVLEWSFLKNEQDINVVRDAYKIDPNYQILGTDELGDIIVLRSSGLYNIEHEDTEEITKIAPVSLLPELMALLEALRKLPVHTDELSVKELREIKKNVISLRKRAPRSLKFLFTNEAESLAEQISDLRFYQTSEGKRFKETLEVREMLYSSTDYPQKYSGIDVVPDPNGSSYHVIGWLHQESENLEELRKIVSEFNTELDIRVEKVRSYEEYQAKIDELAVIKSS